ncbi:TPA: hypothetical protein ACF7ZB_000192 [Kluyvera georgiana]
MKLKLLAAALIAVVVLPACAKRHAHDCTEAVEQVYAHIESVFKKQPKLAYTPVRTTETGGMFMEACKDGMKHGHIHDTAKLNMLFEGIESRAHQPKISTEGARYLLNDTALAQSFLAGYEIGSGESEF